MEKRDWASLCRMYRETLGLKQDAIAYDLNVSQSTVSRWEAGLRNPGPVARRRILSVLEADAIQAPLTGLEMMSAMTDILSAVWDSKGRLRAMSSRMRAELSEFSRISDPIGLAADEFVNTEGLMDFAQHGLHEAGFFDGRVQHANMRSRPVGNPRRMDMGGTLSVSGSFIVLPDGESAVLCFYDHDILRPPPSSPELVLSGRPLPVIAPQSELLIPA